MPCFPVRLPGITEAEDNKQRPAPALLLLFLFFFLFFLRAFLFGLFLLGKAFLKLGLYLLGRLHDLFGHGRAYEDDRVLGVVQNLHALLGQYVADVQRMADVQMRNVNLYGIGDGVGQTLYPETPRLLMQYASPFDAYCLANENHRNLYGNLTVFKDVYEVYVRKRIAQGMPRNAFKEHRHRLLDLHQKVNEHVRSRVSAEHLLAINV